MTEHNCTITDGVRDQGRFAPDEVGVYKDGAFGNAHVTAGAVRLAHQFGFFLTEREHEVLSDMDNHNGANLSDEDHHVWPDIVDEAVDHLNVYAVAPEGPLYFEFHEGDFRLSNGEEEL